MAGEEEQQLSIEKENGDLSTTPKEGSTSLKRLESGYCSVISQITSDGRIMVGHDIEILPDKERTEYASPATKAYEAKARNLGGEHFALICGCATVPRVTTIGSYKGLKSLHILRLIEAGVIDWMPENCQKFALIYEKPAGKKMMESADAIPYKVSEDHLIPMIIAPAVKALSDFRNIDFIHGAINAENIYMSGMQGTERIILGDCLSSAPSLQQHPLYEMASRAVAQASGRGPGTIKDDLYALGICVVMAARGKNFMLGKSPQQIIYEKIEHGSYGAIIGRERIPGGVSEFLRGVLNDDDDQRWSIDDAMRWLEGRHINPKPSRVILKAARPLIFREQKYLDLRSLAEEFSKNVSDAGVEIEKGQFELWLKRNFEDKALRARFDDICEKEKTAPRDRWIFSVCMALDPFGPLRYKGRSIFPGGLGMALAEAIAQNEDIQIYGEMVLQQFFNDWIGQIFDELPDAAGIMSILEKSRAVLSQKMPGYGIERVLYMLDQEVACMSPILRDYFVLSPGNLLLALESISQSGTRPDTILDRHMIAFISVRERQMIDSHLGYVNSSNKGNQMLGIIRTLAAIQRRFFIGSVPGVGNWLISMTEPIVKLLKDHELRQKLVRAIGRLQDNGNLTALLDLVDDPILIQDDAKRFGMACREYKSLVLEKRAIESYFRKRKYFGKATGRQVAMLFSSVLSVIVIAGYVVLRLMNGI
ncbi:MAG: serine/threonine protein kinase [Alphaproteobacteria bacterium]|nr:serine/threonine protein kinase [Alphaproteobacteria bacterium]